MGNLFWYSVLLDAIVIMSAIGILFTGYWKLRTKNNTITGTTRPDIFSPWIELTGNRLLSTALILGFAISKLVESIKNQTMTVTIVDFISGVVIALIIMFIGYFKDDHPAVAGWFFCTDYSRFVRMALSKLWSFCVHMFAALLLLPLGTIRMPNAPYIHVPEEGVAIQHMNVIAFDKIIGTMLASLLGFILCEGVLLSSIRSLQWPTRDIGFKLVKRLWNIIFLWAVLWMTLVISVRSNPEVESHIVGIYMRISIDKIVARKVTSEVYSMKINMDSLPSVTEGHTATDASRSYICDNIDESVDAVVECHYI
ncbi:hypothetical protein BDR03DRAFT_353953 [Suillus americanus]|nr:hypothetical protein BDR03DRAFT_353953 [Suillus americanus]